MAEEAKNTSTTFIPMIPLASLRGKDTPASETADSPSSKGKTVANTDSPLHWMTPPLPNINYLPWDDISLDDFLPHDSPAAHEDGGGDLEAPEPKLATSVNVEEIENATRQQDPDDTAQASSMHAAHRRSTSIDKYSPPRNHSPPPAYMAANQRPSIDSAIDRPASPAPGQHAAAPRRYRTSSSPAIEAYRYGDAGGTANAETFPPPQYRYHLSPPSASHPGRKRAPSPPAYTPPMAAYTSLPPGTYMIESQGRFSIVEEPAYEELYHDGPSPRQGGDVVVVGRDTTIPLSMVFWMFGWILPLLWVFGTYWMRSPVPREKYWACMCAINAVLLAIVIIVVAFA
ncbi:hypothetical protein SYNPS1DRAFT_21100 [Syncephalis pseudoplumigaleata]|uniref:Uncharacterized protein n=1 Tax=Syncephalis pseudoplumigaleata TaxID=1712513 RepID=A0A4P9Z6P8_9FUNG|nr:hypothetical protein SYNPS1DRAFT_21100 [Syncephalis pseudoplumigaleata]|eukprot:RKP27350.1 hypothetical protein SYNPS1DRAFT_21100 [Syncephalis pseudoplumigaleata]